MANKVNQRRKQFARKKKKLHMELPSHDVKAEEHKDLNDSIESPDVKQKQVACNSIESLLSKDAHSSSVNEKEEDEVVMIESLSKQIVKTVEKPSDLIESLSLEHMTSDSIDDVQSPRVHKKEEDEEIVIESLPKQIRTDERPSDQVELPIYVKSALPSHVVDVGQGRASKTFESFSPPLRLHRYGTDTTLDEVGDFSTVSISDRAHPPELRLIGNDEEDEREFKHTPSSPVNVSIGVTDDLLSGYQAEDEHNCVSSGCAVEPAAQRNGGNEMTFSGHSIDAYTRSESRLAVVSFPYECQTDGLSTTSSECDSTSTKLTTETTSGNEESEDDDTDVSTTLDTSYTSPSALSSPFTLSSSAVSTSAISTSTISTKAVSTSDVSTSDVSIKAVSTSDVSTSDVSSSAVSSLAVLSSSSESTSSSYHTSTGSVCAEKTYASSFYDDINSGDDLSTTSSADTYYTSKSTSSA